MKLLRPVMIAAALIVVMVAGFTAIDVSAQTPEPTATPWWTDPTLDPDLVTNLDNYTWCRTIGNGAPMCINGRGFEWAEYCTTSQGNCYINEAGTLDRVAAFSPFSNTKTITATCLFEMTASKIGDSCGGASVYLQAYYDKANTFGTVTAETGTHCDSSNTDGCGVQQVVWDQPACTGSTSGSYCIGGGMRLPTSYTDVWYQSVYNVQGYAYGTAGCAASVGAHVICMLDSYELANGDVITTGVTISDGNPWDPVDWTPGTGWTITDTWNITQNPEPTVMETEYISTTCYQVLPSFVHGPYTVFGYPLGVNIEATTICLEQYSLEAKLLGKDLGAWAMSLFALASVGAILAILRKS